MRRIHFCFLALLVLAASASPTLAQTATPIPPEPGLGLYWIVEDNQWDGVWVRQGDSNNFDAYWAIEEEEDITASLTIEVKGTQVTVERVDPPNIWNVESCSYTGEFQADGVTVYGTVDCTFTTGETGSYYWQGWVTYEEPVELNWESMAWRYRAAKGEQFSFYCPPDVGLAHVYGTEIYTDDSKICTAATHVGMITQETGGEVTIEILPGQDWYEPSTVNGVSSATALTRNGSFRFIGSEPLIRELSWGSLAMYLRGRNGEQFTFHCPAEDGYMEIYGTDVYADLSSICRAAAHAGLITAEDGGTFTIEVMPGQASYESSTRNGMYSYPSGEYEGSFRFVQ